MLRHKWSLVIQDNFQVINWLYNVSQKIPRWIFLTFFPEWLGIFSPIFTHLLYVPIYAGVQICIQLSATLTKLGHIKRNHHGQNVHHQLKRTLGDRT